MLRFEVFDDQGPARSWPLVNAHLLGRDDLPVAGSVEFSGGEIVCAPREKRATALCLEYDAGPMGRLMLQTCLLALRPEPYRLNQELARHRIKHYIAKSEEWLMFDPALGGEALKRWEQARTLFTEALVMDESAASERRCRDALVAALDAGERLAMSHAQILLHRRFATRPASRTTLGVRVDVGLDPDLVMFRDREELSGGMAKRVAVARALVMDPILVMYDESRRTRRTPRVCRICAARP